MSAVKKAVIITGATGYFGRYFVKALVKDYFVIAIGRDEAKLTALQREFGPQVIMKRWELSDLERLGSQFDDLAREYQVVGLVNNAFPLGKSTGFNTPEGKLEKIKPEMLLNAFTAGAVAPLVLTQAYGNYLISNGLRGKIVNISSMYAMVAPDPGLYKGKETFNPISYGMVKAALEYQTKYVASFWGDSGIRCNAIAPGPFPNVEFESENATQDQEFLSRLKDKTCNRQIGHPSQLIDILKLLLSDGAEFINGEVIHVDGGWTVR